MKPFATSLLLRSLYHNSDASTHPYSALSSLTTTVPLVQRNFSYDRSSCISIVDADTCRMWTSMPVGDISAFKNAPPMSIAKTLRFFAAAIAAIVSTGDVATVGDGKSS